MPASSTCDGRVIPHEFAAATDLVRQKRHKSSRVAVAAGLNQAAGAMSLFSTHAAARLECHLPNCSSASAAAATICQRARHNSARGTRQRGRHLQEAAPAVYVHVQRNGRT